MSIRCDKCQREFEPTHKQINLIERARLGKLPLAIVVCPFCKRGTTITQPKEASEPPLLRCPCAGCTGWVSNILDVRVAEPPPKWGCGECGEVWLDDAALRAQVTEILTRYPHRAAVYRQADDGWSGVPVNDEPRGYSTMVEQAESRCVEVQSEAQADRATNLVPEPARTRAAQEVVQADRPVTWDVVAGLGIGPIHLGMSKRAVRKLLGPPSRAERASRIRDVRGPASDYFWNGAIHVEYVDQVVSFVGVNRTPAIDVTLRGVSVFDVLFRELGPWLAAQAGVDSTDPDFPASWVFPDWALCIHRSSDELDWAEPRGTGDESALFAEQVSIDQRFARSLTRSRGDAVAEPTPAASGRSADELWREIDRTDPGGRDWRTRVERLRQWSPAASNELRASASSASEPSQFAFLGQLIDDAD